MNPGLFPIFSCYALTDCVYFKPISYKCVILFVLAQWRLVLLGNTVLKFMQMLCNQMNYVFPKKRMCQQRNCWLWLLIWQLLVAKNFQVQVACDSKEHCGISK